MSGSDLRVSDKGGSRRKLLAGLALATFAAPVVAHMAQSDRPRAAPRLYPRPTDASFETLEVGPGRQFASLTLAGCFMNSEDRWNNGYIGAERVAQMGFRIIVSPGPPGYYVNDSGSHSRRWPTLVGWPPYDGRLLGPVIIEGEAGKPAPVLETDGHGDGVLYYQTGLFATGNFDATFRRLIFRGFRRRDGGGNYAAIRLGQSFLAAPMASQVLIEDCEFSGCDNGLMGGVPGQTLTIRRSYFHDNGSGTGFTHNLYVGPVDRLVVEDVLSTRCSIGHLLKSRAAETVIQGSRLLGMGGSESACLDVPNGGALQIDDTVCEKSARSDAIWLIHYAGENQDEAGLPFHRTSSIRIRNLNLSTPERLLHRPSWGPVLGLANQSGLGEKQSGKGSRFIRVEAQGVAAYGLTQRTAGLPCSFLSSPPRLDSRSPVRI